MCCPKESHQKQVLVCFRTTKFSVAKMAEVAVPVAHSCAAKASRRSFAREFKLSVIQSVVLFCDKWWFVSINFKYSDWWFAGLCKRNKLSLRIFQKSPSQLKASIEKFYAKLLRERKRGTYWNCATLPTWIRPRYRSSIDQSPFWAWTMSKSSMTLSGHVYFTINERSIENEIYVQKSGVSHSKVLEFAPVICRWFAVFHYLVVIIVDFKWQQYW